MPALFIVLAAGPFESHGQPSANVPAAMPPGLVGYWAAEGDANDSVGTNHGYLHNGVGFDNGIAGYGFSFDGHSSYVRIPGNPGLDPGNEVTVELWMKPDTNNAMQTYQGLVASDFCVVEIANGEGQPRMGVHIGISTDRAATGPWPQTADANGGGFPVTAGVWHHIVGTYDGTKLQLYVDGQPAGKPFYHTGAISPMLPGDGIAIGSEERRPNGTDPSSGRYFNGMIDEVALYNRALSAAEILARYKAGLAGKLPAPTPGTTPAAVPVPPGPSAPSADPVPNRPARVPRAPRSLSALSGFRTP